MPKEAITCILKKLLAVKGFFCDELQLVDTVAEHLGSQPVATREVPIGDFQAPRFEPPSPPPDVSSPDDVLAKHSSKSRRLDLLWRRGASDIALEFKYQRLINWRGSHHGKSIELAGWSSADYNGYLFLKDIYKLERLISVNVQGKEVVPDLRFVVFLCNNPLDIEGRTPHQALSLKNRTLRRGHTVEYNAHKPDGSETSAQTRWLDYPPFRLAGEYQLQWIGLEDDVSAFVPDNGCGPYTPSSLLIVKVDPQ